MRSKELFYWISERWKIFENKELKHLPKPWTEDTILQTYRFCNVHRENDRVTQWIATNWRGPFAKDPHLWFAMCVARFINLPEALDEITYPVPWNVDVFLFITRDRRRRNKRNFNSAYIVSTNGRAMDKLDYLVQYVFNPLWENRDNVLSLIRRSDTLADIHDGLMGFQGMGSFMSAQIIADMKYVGKMLKAKDWWTFAASGPGSRRGLNRVLGRDKDSPWRESDWHEQLMELKSAVDPLVSTAGIPDVHAQDLQNCLCEFDKYERVRLGEGRPKSLYPGR